MEREIKIKYVLVKPKSIISEIFTIKQIEFGEAHDWLSNNLAYEKQIKRLCFAGLHDKNGVEIYKGDVLNKKTTFENNMADKRFQSDTEITVGFENGCFVDINSGVSLYEKMKIVSSYRHDVWTNYEIIN